MDRKHNKNNVEFARYLRKNMTPEERLKPEIINGSRRKRIAKGCGLGVEDVNRLLKQFDQMKKMMKQLSGKGMKKMLVRRMVF